MNESIILSENIKAYFSSHASLAALGRKVSKHRVFEPIAQKVKIAQKTVKYRPSEKLMDAFISLLAGAQGKAALKTAMQPCTTFHSLRYHGESRGLGPASPTTYKAIRRAQ